VTAELVQGLETIMSSNSQSHNKTRTELFSPSCITFALSDNHTPSAAQVPVPAVRDCCLAAPAEAFHHAAQVAQPLADANSGSRLIPWPLGGVCLMYIERIACFTSRYSLCRKVEECVILTAFESAFPIKIAVPLPLYR